MYSLIHCEFRLITKMSSRDADRFLGRVDLPQAPDVGEGFKFNGHPYVVADRGWAASNDEDPDLGLWCYLRVLQAEEKI